LSIPVQIFLKNHPPPPGFLRVFQCNGLPDGSLMGALFGGVRPDYGALLAARRTSLFSRE